MRPASSWLHVLTAIALGFGLLAGAPRARACRFIEPLPPPPPDRTELHWGIAYGVGASVVTAAVAAQIAMGDEMFPGWAAALELSLGLAQTIAGPLVVAAVALEPVDACTRGPDAADEALIAAGLLVGTGGWLIAHAIWSLADGSLDEPPAVMPTVSVGRDGAALHVLGVF